MLCQKYLESGKRNVVWGHGGLWCTQCHMQLDWPTTRLQTASFYSVQKGQKLKTLLTSGNSFLTFTIKQSYTRTYHMLYSLQNVLQNVTAKWWFFKKQKNRLLFFLRGAIFPWAHSRPAQSSELMYYVDCRLHSGEKRGAGGVVPQETVTLHPPLFSLLHLCWCWWSYLFHRPVLEIISCFCFLYCCPYSLLFRRDIYFWCWSCLLCSVTAALHSAFCCRGWVFEEAEEETRGRGWVWDQSEGSYDDYIS